MNEDIMDADPEFAIYEQGHAVGITGISDDQAKCPYERGDPKFVTWWAGFSDGLPEGDPRIGQPPIA